MELRRIEVDHHLREAIYYKDASFPVDIWTDVYQSFVDQTMNCHWHNVFEFGVMLSGTLHYYMNGERMELKEGDCVFVNANTMHMAEQSEDCDDAVMFTIVFPPSLFAGGREGSLYQKYFRPILEADVPGFKIEDSVQGRSVVEALKEIYALDDTEYGYELRCLSLIIRAWEAMSGYLNEYGGARMEIQPKKKDERKAKDVLSYIHEHYTQSISIDEIARYAGISRSACFRCFARFTNKKPVEYINEYRLAHAARMLKETEHTIAEVCMACGFTSSSYFGKLFLKKYAVTPLRYRQG